jgi:outer membrane receptor protein involved in Fe transport
MRMKAASFAIVVTAIAANMVPDLQAQEATISLEQLGGLSLEELLDLKITTASLRPQQVREVPATTYVVTEEDFRRYGYRDLKDILRNLPGIDYVWPGSHLFGGQRGFSSQWELTKLLIDGREANAMANDAVFIGNQFNLTGVKRVEIVQGPASVLYGPEAFSGVINIITKDADNNAEGIELAGIAGGGDHSSLDGSGAFHTIARKGPLGLAAGGYLEGGRGPDHTDFIKTPQFAEVGREARIFLLDNGYPYRNDSRNHKLNADLTYSPLDRVLIQAGVLYLREENGGGLEASQGAYTNTQSIIEQTHFHASGEYGFATAPVKATLSVHHMGEDFWNRLNSNDTTAAFPPYLIAFNYEDTRLDVVNLQVDYTPAFIDNYFLVGAGTRDTRVGEPAFTGLTPNDTLPGQSTPAVGRYLYPPTGFFSGLGSVLHQNRLYVYAQDQQYFWSRRIQITAGMRYDYNNIYGSIWNFRSGLLLRPWPNYTFRGLFGQGFREPTVVQLVNRDLEPARMNFWEASFLFTPVPNLFGQIAYFQNYATDLIVVAPAPGTPFGILPQNLGEKQVGGVESLIRYQAGPIAGDLWHSYEYAIDDQPLVGTAENKLGFGGHYSLGDNLSLGLRAKYTDRVEGLALEAGGNPISITVPRYFTLDANALARELEFAGVQWDVTFSVFNILDRENLYANTFGPNPSRFPAEGREYFGKVAVRF